MKLVGSKDLVDAVEMAEKIMADKIQAGLAYLGHECVKQIREKGIDEGSWHDRDGNLRSSIGYAIVDHGRVKIKSAFEAVSGPSGKGTKGAKIGDRYIDSLANQFADAYVLLMVAGMDYAPYVEAKGYDVLAGAKIHAELEIDRVLKVFMKRADKKISAMLKKI